MHYSVAEVQNTFSKPHYELPKVQNTLPKVQNMLPEVHYTLPKPQNTLSEVQCLLPKWVWKCQIVANFDVLLKNGCLEVNYPPAKPQTG